MSDVDKILHEHSFFKGLTEDDLRRIGACGKNKRVSGGFLFREGEAADCFFILREGKISLEIGSPRQGPISLMTLGAGDVVGWSWLFPPYQWHFDARIVEPVIACAIDAHCLREKCETDPAFGYSLMKRFARVMLERLQSTRRSLVHAHEVE